MYSYIWIEGERNLDEFCLKRFGCRPRFMETIGTLEAPDGTVVKAHKIYKEDSSGDYHNMFFLFMDHLSGKYTYYQLEEIKRRSYEEIKTDKTAILRKRG